MSRPLELVAYRPCGCDPSCEFYLNADWEGPDPGGGDPSILRWLNPAKRLTDAELAAEYWKASERVRSCAHPALKVQRANALAKLQTLHRFAIHPHYDEVDQ